LVRFKVRDRPRGQAPLALETLCLAAADALALAAVVVRLVPADGEGVVVAASPAGRELGALEALSGEGPGRSAYLDRRPIFLGDLARHGSLRWAGFATPAVVATVFVIPLSVGAARLGTLEGFGAVAEPWSCSATEVALGFAQLATEMLTSPPTGCTEPALDEEFGRALDYRAEIAHAQGMLTIDQGVDLVEALILLGAHAFSENKTLLELARQIKDGYRLPPEPGLREGSERKEGPDDQH
jgi:hypothetical protein